MSLFTNPIRPAPIASDAAVRHYIEAIRRQIEPDPLFQRRLRGDVANRFVAQKRGVVHTAPRRPSRMGTLGRACLYASFALAVSVTGVMAASDAAIPGDVLYPVTLSLEEVRLSVLPEEYHDELAAYVLSERIGELRQLAEAGDVTRASALAGPIHDAYEQALAEGGDAGPLARRLEREVSWLAQVANGLPSEARASITSAMAGAPGLTVDAWTAGGSEPGAEWPSSTGSGRGPGPQRGSGQGNGSGQSDGSGKGTGAAAAENDDPSADATPNPAPTPTPTPKAERTAKPEPTPTGAPSAAPKPSPNGEASGHAPAP
jgi:hypothetical protein